ncbi:MAG: GNAT family N-acetyltransferase [Rhodobacterales bacterium]|nr:GNAT family N-acetyltransferase [Rhodobacterales bacterium]
MITVRRATLLDAAPLADLLNAIAEARPDIGTRAISTQDMAQMMRMASDRSAWHVALNRDGALRGFQYVEPSPILPPEACDIATFVQPGKSRLGFGSALFAQTQQVVRSLGYAWISADIGADNESALIYYQSRGFRPYGRSEGARMDKILMRYDI